MRLILRNAKTTTEGKTYTAQFWTPGLVSYCDSGDGVALLRKEAMDAMLPSFVGKPVTIEHVEGSPEEIENSGKAVGKVTKAYWNPDTGWYNCDFTVENDEAKTKVESGWSVSCAFDVSDQTGPAGEYNAIPYQEEITSGTFTHLALVENPRYEDSKIFKNHKMRLNSKCVNGLGDQLQKTLDKEIERRKKEIERMKIAQEDAHKDNAGKCPICGLPAATPGEHNPDVARCTGHTEAEWSKSKKNERTTLVDEIMDAIPAAKLTEQACINYAEENGYSKAEGQRVWQLIHRELRGLKNAVDTKAAVAYIDAELRRDETISESAMIAKVQAHFPINEEAAEDLVGEAMGFRGKHKYTPRKNDTSDFGTILREIKEQLYQMAQALAGKFNGRAGVFKKGDSVRDVYGDWCTIVGEAQSGEYYVVKYADGSTARMREGDLNNSKENAGEPYSVSIEHKPEERGGDVYRVALIKDGKEADHILVKGDAAAQEQKKKWLKQYNSKQNDAFGENIIRVKFRTKRGSTEEKYTTVEEFSSEANARLRASALNWDILSIEPIKKNSRVILKPGKSNSTQEKKPMFGLFKRKSKKNDQEAAPEKLPLEQIDVEIDGVAVPLSELVTGYKAEQAEVAEKQKLEQAQAAKEVTEAPAPEANADNTAPEDLNLENQEFSVEDGSRYNMTELVDSYNRRKAAKCNAEAEEKAKAGLEKETKENSYGNYMIADDLKKGMSPDEVVKRIMARYSDIKEPQARAIVEAVQKGGPNAQADWSKNNAQETDEEKAAREKKEADDKAAKENAKKDPKYFHKLNDLKNAGEVITGKAIETLSDKIERGNARYGSKKK